MKSYLLPTLAVVLLAAGSGAVLAQSDGDREFRDRGGRHHQGGWRGAGDPDRMLERMTRRLDLSDAQQQNIANHLEAVKPEFESLRERSRANRTALRELNTADADYAARLDTLAVEQGQLATERTMLMGRVRAQVAAELTDEQRAEMAEMRDRASRRFERGRRGRGSESQEL